MDAFRMYAPTSASRPGLTGTGKSQRTTTSGSPSHRGSLRARSSTRRSSGARSGSGAYSNRTTTTTATTATTAATTADGDGDLNHSARSDKSWADDSRRISCDGVQMEIHRSSPRQWLSSSTAPRASTVTAATSTAARTSTTPSDTQKRSSSGKNDNNNTSAEDERRECSSKGGRSPGSPGVRAGRSQRPSTTLADGGRAGGASPRHASSPATRKRSVTTTQQETPARPFLSSTVPCVTEAPLNTSNETGASQARVKPRLVYAPRRTGSPAPGVASTGPRASSSAGLPIRGATPEAINAALTARLPPGSPLTTVDALSPYAKVSAPVSSSEAPTRLGHSSHKVRRTASRQTGRAASRGGKKRKNSNSAAQLSVTSETPAPPAPTGAEGPLTTMTTTTATLAAELVYAPEESKRAAKKKKKKKSAPQDAADDDVSPPATVQDVSHDGRGTTTSPTCSSSAPSNVPVLPPATPTRRRRGDNAVKPTHSAHDAVTVVEMPMFKESLTSLPALGGRSSSPYGSLSSSQRSHASQDRERGRAQEPLVAIMRRSGAGVSRDSSGGPSTHLSVPVRSTAHDGSTSRASATANPTEFSPASACANTSLHRFDGSPSTTAPDLLMLPSKLIPSPSVLGGGTRTPEKRRGSRHSVDTHMLTTVSAASAPPSAHMPAPASKEPPQALNGWPDPTANAPVITSTTIVPTPTAATDTNSDAPVPTNASATQGSDCAPHRGDNDVASQSAPPPPPTNMGATSGHHNSQPVHTAPNSSTTTNATTTVPSSAAAVPASMSSRLRSPPIESLAKQAKLSASSTESGASRPPVARSPQGSPIRPPLQPPPSAAVVLHTTPLQADGNARRSTPLFSSSIGCGSDLGGSSAQPIFSAHAAASEPTVLVGHATGSPPLSLTGDSGSQSVRASHGSRVLSTSNSPSDRSASLPHTSSTTSSAETRALQPPPPQLMSQVPSAPTPTPSPASPPAPPPPGLQAWQEASVDALPVHDSNTVTTVEASTDSITGSQHAPSPARTSLTSRLSHDSGGPTAMQMRLLSYTTLYNSHTSAQPTPLANRSHTTSGTNYSSSSAVASPVVDNGRDESIDENFFSETPAGRLPMLLSASPGSPLSDRNPSFPPGGGSASHVRISPDPKRKRSANMQRPPMATRSAGRTVVAASSLSSHPPATASGSIASISAGASTTAMWMDPSTPTTVLTSLNDLLNASDAPHPLMTNTATSLHSDHGGDNDDNNDDDDGVDVDAELDDASTSRSKITHSSPPQSVSAALASSICSAATLPPGKTNSFSRQSRPGRLRYRPAMRRPLAESSNGRQSLSHLQDSVFDEEESEERQSTIESRSRRASFSNTVMLGTPMSDAVRLVHSGRISTSIVSSTNVPLSSRTSVASTGSTPATPCNASGVPSVATPLESSDEPRQPPEHSDELAPPLPQTTVIYPTPSIATTTRTAADVAAHTGETPRASPLSAKSRRASSGFGTSTSTYSTTDGESEWTRLPLGAAELESALSSTTHAATSSTMGTAAHMSSQNVTDAHLKTSPIPVPLDYALLQQQRLAYCVSPSTPPQQQQQQQQPQQAGLTSILVGGSLLRPLERPGTTSLYGPQADPSMPAGTNTSPEVIESPDTEPLIQFIDVDRIYTPPRRASPLGGADCETGNGAIPGSRSGTRSGVVPSFVDGESPFGVSGGDSAARALSGVSLSGGGNTAALTHSMSLMSRASLYCPTFPDVFLNSGTSVSSLRTSPSGGPLRPTSQPFTTSANFESMGLRLGGLNNNNNIYNGSFGAGGAGAADTEVLSRATSSPSFWHRDEYSGSGRTSRTGQGTPPPELQQSLSLTTLGKALLHLTGSSSIDTPRDGEWPAAASEEDVHVVPPLFAGQGQLMVDYMTAWQRSHNPSSTPTNISSLAPAGSGFDRQWPPTFSMPFHIPTADQHTKAARAFSLFSNPNSADKGDEEPWTATTSPNALGHGIDLVSISPRGTSSSNSADVTERHGSAKPEKLSTDVSPLSPPGFGTAPSPASTSSTYGAAAAAAAAGRNRGDSAPLSPVALADALATQQQQQQQSRKFVSSGSGFAGRGPVRAGGGGGGGGFHSVLTDIMAVCDDVESSMSLSPTSGFAVGGGSRGNAFFSLLTHGPTTPWSGVVSNNNNNTAEARVSSSSGGGTWHSVLSGTTNTNSISGAASIATAAGRHRQSSSSSSSGSRTTLQTLNRLGTSFKSGTLGGSVQSAAQSTTHGFSRAPQWSVGQNGQRESVGSNTTSITAGAALTSPAADANSNTTTSNTSIVSSGGNYQGRLGPGTGGSLSSGERETSAPPSATGKRSFTKHAMSLHADKTGTRAGPNATQGSAAGPTRRSGAVVQLREPSLTTTSPLGPGPIHKIYDAVTGEELDSCCSTNPSRSMSAAGSVVMGPGRSGLVMPTSALAGRETKKKTSPTPSGSGVAPDGGLPFAAKARQRTSLASSALADSTSAVSPVVPSPNMGHAGKQRLVGAGGAGTGLRAQLGGAASTATSHTSSPVTEAVLAEVKRPQPQQRRGGETPTPKLVPTTPLDVRVGAHGRTPRGSLANMSSPTSLIAPPSVNLTNAPALHSESHNVTTDITQDVASPPLRDVYSAMSPNFNGTVNTFLSFLSPDDGGQDFLVSASEPHSSTSAPLTIESSLVSGSRSRRIDTTMTAGAIAVPTTRESPDATVALARGTAATHNYNNNTNHGINNSPLGRVEEDGEANGASSAGPIHSLDSPDTSALRVRTTPDPRRSASRNAGGAPSQTTSKSDGDGADSPHDEAASPRISVSSSLSRSTSRQMLPGEPGRGTGAEFAGFTRFTPQSQHADDVRGSSVPAPPAVVVTPVASPANGPRFSAGGGGATDLSALLHKFNAPSGINDSSLFGDMLPSVYLGTGASVSSVSLQPTASPFDGELRPLPASATAQAFSNSLSNSSLMRAAAAAARGHTSGSSPNAPMTINVSDRTPKWRVLDSRVGVPCPGGAPTVGPSPWSQHAHGTWNSDVPSPLQTSLTADGAGGAAAADSVVTDESLSSVIPSLLYAPRELQSELQRRGWGVLIQHLSGTDGPRRAQSRHLQLASTDVTPRTSPITSPGTSITAVPRQRRTSSGDSLETDPGAVPESAVLAVNTTNLRELLGLPPTTGHETRSHQGGHAHTTNSSRRRFHNLSREHSSAVISDDVAAGANMAHANRTGNGFRTVSTASAADDEHAPHLGHQATQFLQAPSRRAFASGHTRSNSCSTSSVLIASDLNWGRDEGASAGAAGGSAGGGGGLNPPTADAATATPTPMMTAAKNGAGGERGFAGGKRGVTGGANSSLRANESACSSVTARDARHGLMLSTGGGGGGTMPGCGSRTAYGAPTFRDTAELSLHSAIPTPNSSPLVLQAVPRTRSSDPPSLNLDEPLMPVGSPKLVNSALGDGVVIRSGLSAINRLPRQPPPQPQQPTHRDSLSSTSSDTRARIVSADSLIVVGCTPSSDDLSDRGDAAQARAALRRQSSKATSGKKTHKSGSIKTYKRGSRSSTSGAAGTNTGTTARRKPSQGGPNAISAIGSPTGAMVARHGSLGASPLPGADPTLGGVTTAATGKLSRPSGPLVDTLLLSPPFTPFDAGSALPAVMGVPVTSTVAPVGLSPTSQHLSIQRGAASSPHAGSALGGGDAEAQRMRLVPPPAAPSNTLNPRISIGRESVTASPNLHLPHTSASLDGSSVETSALEVRHPSQARSSPLPVGAVGTTQSPTLNLHVDSWSTSPTTASHSASSFSFPVTAWECSGGGDGNPPSHE